MLELVEPTGQCGLMNTGSGQNGLDFDLICDLFVGVGKAYNP